MVVIRVEALAEWVEFGVAVFAVLMVFCVACLGSITVELAKIRSKLEQKDESKKEE